MIAAIIYHSDQGNEPELNWERQLIISRCLSGLFWDTASVRIRSARSGSAGLG